MYYVYLLDNQTDKSWYIGMTEDLNERLKRHNAGDGARTTSRKEGWKPIYFEAYLNKNDALGREKFLKSGSGRRYLKKRPDLKGSSEHIQKIYRYYIAFTE